MGNHGIENSFDLPSGFPGPVDHLSRSLADAPVGIHLGVADVRKGLLFELQQGLVHADGPFLNAFQQGTNVTIHL